MAGVTLGQGMSQNKCPEVTSSHSTQGGFSLRILWLSPSRLQRLLRRGWTSTRDTIFTFCSSAGLQEGAQQSLLHGSSCLSPQLSILSCCGGHGIPLGCGGVTRVSQRSPALGGTLPHRSFWVTPFVFKVCWKPLKRAF